MSPTTTFIPTTRIQDIVIHEAFKGLEVRFYLAVIVEGATEVVVVFPVSRFSCYRDRMKLKLADTTSSTECIAASMAWYSRLSVCQ
jgi:GPI-GlcNAc transferase complex, PIG-H component